MNLRQQYTFRLQYETVNRMIHDKNIRIARDLARDLAGDLARPLRNSGANPFSEFEYVDFDWVQMVHG